MLDQEGDLQQTMAKRLRPICFIHIEKTGGTSFYKTVLEPNCVRHVRPGGLSAWRRADADLLSGHMPYLSPHILGKEVDYVTMLRDPVDRAISWYYFITQGIEFPELFKGHPLRRYARNITIVEFYEDPRFSNIQSRFMAGYHYNKLYPLLYKNKIFLSRLLNCAKINLERCAVFGIQSYFRESVRLAESTFRWPRQELNNKRYRASSRLSVDDIERRAPHVLDSLRELHQLDYELFSYARELFENRLREEGLL